MQWPRKSWLGLIACRTPHTTTIYLACRRLKPLGSSMGSLKYV